MSFRRRYGSKQKTRSGFEQRVMNDLTKRGIEHTYETLQLNYIKRECPHCGEVVDRGTYKPDFIIPRKSGVRLVVEGKGYLDSANRTLMQRVKRDNPDEDIRFLFQRDQPIRKGSKTTYSQWAQKNGFPWAIGESIPSEWL